MEGRRKWGGTSNNSEDLNKCELMDGSCMLQQDRVEPGLEMVRDHA